MSDGQVIFEITGDNKSVKKSITDTTNDIKEETKKWDKYVDDSSGNMSGSLVGAFETVVKSAAFVKIAQMLAQLMGESIQLASDLEEVQNVVDVTFGKEGSKKIEAWAKSAGNQFGLTELQAKRYASTLGAMMKSSGMTEDQILDMSTGLAGLAADMASFYNLPFDEAFSKIQSGMAGMSMPLRQLGIDMTETAVAAYAASEGYDTAFNKLSEQEQTVLRYKYLMKVTADAQGDFARTSDSYANSQRRIATGMDTLKAQLGEAILPIATQVSDAIADFLDILTYQPPETAFDVAGDAIADAAGNAAQAQGILGYLDKLYAKYGDMATNTEEWATAMEKLKTVFPDINKYIDEETGALTLSNEQLKEYVENTKQAAIEAAKQNAIKQLNDQYTQAGMDYYTAEINRDIANEQAKEAALGIIDYLVEGYKRNGVTAEDEDSYLIDRNAWLEGLQNGNMSMGEMMNMAYRFANEQGDDYSVLERYEEIYNEQKTAAESASKEMNSLSDNMKSLEVDISIANEALARLSAAAGNAAYNVGNMGAADGSYASGLDFVPRDGFRAILHRGERIQTAAEAALYRQYGNQMPGLDYSTIGAVMKDNAGGDVYLDARVVGQVVSGIQGRSYRALERSGWRK